MARTLLAGSAATGNGLSSRPCAGFHGAAADATEPLASNSPPGGSRHKAGMTGHRVGMMGEAAVADDPFAGTYGASYQCGMSEIVEHIPGPDKKVRITIYRRPDGRFECSLDKFYVDSLPEYDHHMEYWATTHRWGIFDSVTTAKREALAEYPLAKSDTASGS